MLSFIHKKEMLFSNINLKHIKKTEHSLSEDTGRIPYIYCHWDFNMYNPYPGTNQTEMCTQTLGNLVKMQTQVQWVEGEAWDVAFQTSFQVMPILLIHRTHSVWVAVLNRNFQHALSLKPTIQFLGYVRNGVYIKILLVRLGAMTKAKK